MSDTARIAVGIDRDGWHDRVLSALGSASPAGVSFEPVDLESHGWIERVRDFDTVVWNPGYMGPISALYFKEKVFFLETVLRKRVIPNLASTWHFECKVSQSYLFEALDVPTPRTVVSFDRADAHEQAEKLGLPIVAKLPWGAKSEGVKLLRTSAQVRRYIDTEFKQQAWDQAKEGSQSTAAALASSLGSPWFPAKIRQALTGGERTGCVLLQEFLPGNDSDLRINVFGPRAVGYWRRNREGDFRASGAGLRDYDRPIPPEPLRLCLDVNDRLGADFMAYDLLFRDGEPLVVEMSYGSIPATVHGAAGHWLANDGDMEWIPGQSWPQELIVLDLLEEISARETGARDRGATAAREPMTTAGPGKGDR